MTRKGNIAILATLDTKGEEVASMKRHLGALGYAATIVDIGVRDSSALRADISNGEVARQSGWELSALSKTGQRDRIMEEMGKGAEKVLSRLYAEGRIDGVIGLGGNQGSAISSLAMRSLPIGFPKYLVSTVASGNIRPYVRDRDIGVIFSVGDLLGGPNPVTASILANAVAAVVGMVEYGERIAIGERIKTIAVTALGNTETGANRAVTALRARGFQVVPFHASGAGGSAMEGLIESGIIQGVLDLTPHELTEEVVGAGVYQPVRSGRLTAAGAKGIPQVVSTGGLEYLCFGPQESIPLRFRRRKIYMHNPFNANIKASQKEMAQIGRVMAERLNGATGPTAVMVPLAGWSIYGAKGGPLHDEAGNRALLKTLKNGLREDLFIEEIDARINDEVFIDLCVDRLINFMEA
ncbi:MAG: Tm-1-like ATP-binding domain-containing protein [Smithellaceae bacterium]|nr:Tm-1-like ATP-binding domain-containing protein [Smithellaceae bacterium]